ncbi:MAG: PEP-CTERM sorting domain-containing protein [Planctomycetota bacterium]|nr:PEP-CTERM sorting domain-containing protein [Planctomycetota bacterium]
MAQITVPTSHPGSLPGQPTSSIIISASDLATYQGWWTTPANAEQQRWRDSVNSTASGALTLAVPADYNAAATQARIAQAKALRWLLDPTNPNAAADKTAVTSVLTTYAKVPGGTVITRPEVVQGYYQAFDFINAGLSATERTNVTSRLSGSNVKGTITGLFNEPTQVNNQKLKHASTRALGALLFNDNTDIDTQLGRINASLATNTTNDGGYTDSQNHYQNYAIAQFAPFLKAYKNETGINLGANIKPLVDMSLGMRLPNGTNPSLHNGFNSPVGIHQYASLISDSAVRAAALWNVTQVAGHDWTSWTNIVNNDWTYTDFMAVTDFSTTPAAPNWSPTFHSTGQSKNAAFRNDWTTTSDYLGITGGIDGASGAGFVHYDTGEIYIAARGTNVIVGPGYDRRDLSNTPSGFNASLATEHNIILAKDTGGATWGAGNASAQTNTGTTSVLTNRLDSTEKGNFKGVSDFASLDWNYGAGSSAGNDVSGRRNTAFANEGYFIVADNFTRTDATNKDFAFNLVGKGTRTTITNTTGLIEVKWEVANYGTYNNGATISGPPYNAAQNGQVIEHIVGTGNMTLATDTTWMHENYNLYQVTNRMRASITNAASGGFISILETGTAGSASKFAITNLSTANYAAAKVVNATDGWTDDIMSQATATSRTFDTVTSDARYAYVRFVGSTINSLMIAQGTTVANSGSNVIVATSPITLSLLFDWNHPGSVLGNVSADNFTANTELRLYGLSDILSATINGSAITFTNGVSYDSVILPSGGALAIAYSPEPASGLALVMGAGLLGARRRRR